MSMFAFTQRYHRVLTSACEVLVREGIHPDFDAARKAIGSDLDDSYQEILDEEMKRSVAGGSPTAGPEHTDPSNTGGSALDEIVREALIVSGHIPSSPLP